MKTEKMTSRERVISAVNHRPVDRVPIDLGVYYATGINAFAYWNLREFLGLGNDNIEICDVGQFLARVDEDVLRRFHCDCKFLYLESNETACWNPRGKYEFILPRKMLPRKTPQNEWLLGEGDGILKMFENGYYFDNYPREVSLIDSYKKSGRPVFEVAPDEIISKVAAEAEKIYKDTDYATFYVGYDGYFMGAYFFQDNMDWLCRLMTDPGEVMEMNEKQLENDLKSAGKVIDAMGKYVQGICFGGDLGSQIAPLVNPFVYEEVVAPTLRKFCSFIHENSDMKVFTHSCGAVKQFIPILIDCGVDILNPVQISAAGMDPVELKKEFGDKMVFWGGGCDTQSVLPAGTVQEVRDNVRKLMNVFKKGCGFVFNQVHNIMGDVPAENIVAMLDTAYEESFYTPGNLEMTIET